MALEGAETMSSNKFRSDRILIGDPQYFRRILTKNLSQINFHVSIEAEDTIEVEKERVKIRVSNFNVTREKAGYMLSYNINVVSPHKSLRMLGFFCVFLSFPFLFVFLLTINPIFLFLFIFCLLIALSIIFKPSANLAALIEEVNREIREAAERSLEYAEPPEDLPNIKKTGIFSHGIEREYALVTREGEMYRDIAGHATEAFSKIIDSLHPYYTLSNVEERNFRLIGRDEAYPTQWEIATRVCHNLDDLERELTHLVKLSIKHVKESGYALIASGAHPFEEPNLGEFFSEHHHIGAESNEEKTWIYNMIRNFIPEIMALTVNSPILLGKPSGVKSVRMDVKNPNVGPIEGAPYIMEYNPEQIARIIRKGDARLMDVTPFSRQPTVEVRIMDNQLSIERSIAMAAILEALALKAKKMLMNREPVPFVSQEVLAKNREAALTHGLSAIFDVDENIKLAYHGSRKRKIRAFEAVEEMLKFVSEELYEIGASNRHLMPIIASIKLAKNGKGGTLADWQLQIFRSLEEKLSGESLRRAFLEFLISESERSCNPDRDPICRIISVSEQDVIEVLGRSLRGEIVRREVCPNCGAPIEPYTASCKKCRAYLL